MKVLEDGRRYFSQPGARQTFDFASARRGLIGDITDVWPLDGAELLVDSTLLNAVMPGQRMALGRTLIEPVVNPTQLAVTIEVAAWLHPATTEGGLTTDAVVTEPEPNGGAITRFTVRSTWPEPEEGVDVTAIYRALDGRILGAESTVIPLVQPDGEAADLRWRDRGPSVAGGG